MISGSLVLLYLILFPLLSFAILAFFNKKLRFSGSYLGIFSIFATFVFSLILFYFFCIDEKLKLELKINFLPIKESLNIPLYFLLDRISATMVLVVSFISLLVHIYSLGYMKGDKRFGRYYASLSLFTFSMIGLVLSYNLLFLYIFWELVGLSSYILIGHFFEEEKSCFASIKAFLTTKIGDVGILIAILICFSQIHSLNFDDIFNAIKLNEFAPILRTILGLSLFVGAMGKSAQFPLHIWLPDAMQGPTPVSALIHSATMVSAGVYLVVRLFCVFDDNALLFIAYTGGITSFLFSLVAICQDDIKKVLAYSTISQLGLMFLGLGAGSYIGSFFHLVTHAFFKAGLFLGAGAIIYAAHHNQSMKEYGGLIKKLPAVFVCYLFFSLSLCGIPFFSGFWSKDFILGDILLFYKENNHIFILILGIFATLLTPLYCIRQICLVFFGKPRNKKLYDEIKPVPRVMIYPLYILSFLTLFVGGIYKLKAFDTSWFERFIDGKIVGGKEAINFSAQFLSSHSEAMKYSLIFVLVSTIIALLFYYERKKQGVSFLSPKKLANTFPFLYKLFLNKYYIDEVYRALIIKPYFKHCALLYKFDKCVIDGIVNFWGTLLNKVSYVIKQIDEKFVDNFCVLGISRNIRRLSFSFSAIQTGNVREYLLYSFIGILIFSFLIVYVF